jgi:hypothetical protein
MRYACSILHSSQRFVALFLIVVEEIPACVPTPTPVPTISPTQSITTITPQSEPLPAGLLSPSQTPEIPGLATQLEFDTQHNLAATYYRNPAGTDIALFDPNDKVRNSRYNIGQ